MKAIKFTFWAIGFVLSLIKVITILMFAITLPMIISYLVVRPFGIGHVDWMFCGVLYFTMYCILMDKKLW